MSETYAVSEDDPILNGLIRSGIALEEWRTSTRGMSSADTTFGAIPLLGTGYKVWSLPDKLGRAWNRFFGSWGPEHTVGVEHYYCRPVDGAALGASGYRYVSIGGPPSGAK